jgi:hypothetical protein
MYVPALIVQLKCESSSVNLKVNILCESRNVCKLNKKQEVNAFHCRSGVLIELCFKSLLSLHGSLQGELGRRM